MAEAVSLRTVLATSALTSPLKQGAISSPKVRLDFVEVVPVHKAFAPMVREQAYDLAELAIVTALQAIAYGRPIVLLPVVVASRFQRGCLITRQHGGVDAPDDLRGKRIGVRSYTQTTGMWVRAHLTEDYGLATEDMHWITRDPAHVEQYDDPAFVEHGSDDRGLPELLRAGLIDAAILGNDLPKDDAFKPVIADAAQRDRAWYGQHGFVPTNHMLSASADLCQREPDAVRAAFDLLSQAHAQLAPTDTPSPFAIGFQAVQAPVRYVIDACLEQGLLPRRLSMDEVFGPARTLLDGIAA